MTKLGIMQPYIFPYIGYFQLIAEVDLFVIADDVQWISGGWINRNRILMNGQAQYMTLPLRRDSRRLNINQCRLAQNAGKEKQKILRRLGAAYRKAPCFDAVMDLVERSFACDEENIALFAANTLAECCRYIGIETPFAYSSELDIAADLKAQERVIAINRALNAEHYINLIGGTELYSKEQFREQGIDLSFLKTCEFNYPQTGREFVPNLSILDVLMFNSVEEVAGLLTQFNLV